MDKTEIWALALQKAHSRTTTQNYKEVFVRLQGQPYIHTCRSYVHTPRDLTNGASLARRARELTELQLKRRSDVSQLRPAG